MHKVLVLGASTNPARFSNKAVKSLRRRNIDVVAIGKIPGTIADIEIRVDPMPDESIHIVLIYLTIENQEGYYNYIRDLHPKKVVFNPGAENPAFKNILEEAGIDVIYDCAMVLINSNKLGIQ
ncbi:MAG: CoA-binding protein [Bacteroidetes bacterium]|jgi:predicted CoA-binding protein|nr:CoA-binding protein [Bacteroidota bacterium]